MLFILRKCIEVNNNEDKIENENLTKLVNNIDSSLRFSMGQGDIIMAKINNEKDIIFTDKTFANVIGNFNGVCINFK